MAKIIGIDLGTTNSEAAYMEGGTPKIIPSAEGSAYGGKMFPSVVAFTKDGILVGEPAKRQAVLNPEKTIIQIKRKMGTDYKVKIDGKDYTPPEISAMILRKIKADAEAFLGEKISQAVITVPAYFNDNQRQATKDAGKIAGLEVLRLVNEPTAAALAYGLDKKGEGKICVLDLGGGTFDVTLMEMGDGVFEVVSTSGDTQLGGMDMDNALIQWLVTEFRRDHSVDLSGDRQALQRLRDAAEKAKIELSSTVETTINLPFIAQKDGQPLHLEKKLTRAKLEQLVEPVLERLEVPIRQPFKDGRWPRHPRGRPDPHARRPGAVREDPRPPRGTGRRPDAVRRARRGDPGRRPERRGQGHPPTRRDAAQPRGRDSRWRLHETDRAELDDPDAEERDFHDGGGRPVERGGPCPARRAGDVGRQRQPRPLLPDRHAAGPPRRAEDRGDVRHRRERHPERQCERPGHGEDRETHDHGAAADGPGEDRPGDARRGEPRGGRPPAAGTRRAAQPRGPARLRHGEAPQGARIRDLRGHPHVRRGEARGPQEGPPDGRHREAPRRRRRAERGSPEDRRRDVRQRRPRPRASAGRRRRRRALRLGGRGRGLRRRRQEVSGGLRAGRAPDDRP